MSSEYYLRIHSQQNVTEVLSTICEGMGIPSVITSRERMGKLYFYVKDGPIYRPDGCIASEAIRRSAMSSRQLDIDTIIYFPVDRKIKMEIECLHILQGVVALLPKKYGDMSFTYNDRLLFYRRVGELFVNGNMTHWTIDQLALFPRPYTVCDMDFARS